MAWVWHRGHPTSLRSSFHENAQPGVILPNQQQEVLGSMAPSGLEVGCAEFFLDWFVIDRYGEVRIPAFGVHLDH